ncbi:MAG: hypothetical protein E7353_02715 [Clostridiales bacterium]|nr:hypothetical protein [Clostridiales bacterium]
MKKGTKIFLLVLSFVLVIGVAIGTSFAFLFDRTGTIENVFTVGNIEIELTETNNTYKLVACAEISKDPKVIVKERSEDCWLFIKIDESDGLSEVLKYKRADGWEIYPEYSGQGSLWYRKVSYAETAQEFYVLKDNIVTVEDVTTKKLQSVQNPTLTFTAYACQQLSVNTVQEAWAEVSDLSNYS